MKVKSLGSLLIAVSAILIATEAVTVKLCYAEGWNYLPLMMCRFGLGLIILAVIATSFSCQKGLAIWYGGCVFANPCFQLALYSLWLTACGHRYFAFLLLSCSYGYSVLLF